MRIRPWPSPGLPGPASRWPSSSRPKWSITRSWKGSSYDLKRAEGRIFKYDITGGRYEESDYHAIGSGGKDARTTMKEHFRKDLSEDETLRIALLALYNAAEEDIGTGGPDLVRGIYPTAKLVGASGIADVEDQRIGSVYAALINERRNGD